MHGRQSGQFRRMAGGLAACVLVLSAALPAWGAWSDVVVFGDSLSDVGNVRQRSIDVTFGLFPQPDNRYDRGRFSNGPVWVEHVADALGLDASTRSYRDDGTNYAYGAATTGTGSSNLTITRNVGWQVDEYLLREARTPMADTLVVLWAGANNFLGGGAYTPTPADQLLGYLDRLYDAGARHFLVPNLPPLGQTPRFAGSADEANRDALAAQHNATLAAQLDAFEIDHDAAVYALDIGSLFADLLAAPAASGITNTADEAIDLPAGTDASGHLFWDDVHPTATGHGLIADAALGLLSLLALPGDYDGSGQTEQGDLDLVLQNWGVSFDAVSAAWINQRPAEGVVDQAELDRVLQRWGATNSPDVRDTALPEPGVACVLLVPVLWFRRRAR